MTVYHKCRSCEFRGACEKQAAISQAISSLGITSIKHKCGEYRPFLLPGQNVWVNVQAGPPLSTGYDYDPQPTATFPGVFLQFRKPLDGAVAWVDTGAEPRCGEHRFEPIKGNACAVSFAALRYTDKWRREYAQKNPSMTPRAIVGLREGTTRLCEICNAPPRADCETCLILREIAAA